VCVRSVPSPRKYLATHPHLDKDLRGTTKTSYFLASRHSYTEICALLKAGLLYKLNPVPVQVNPGLLYKLNPAPESAWFQPLSLRIKWETGFKVCFPQMGQLVPLR
jgi:hypothetical protein